MQGTYSSQPHRFWGDPATWPQGNGVEHHLEQPESSTCWASSRHTGTSQSDLTATHPFLRTEPTHSSGSPSRRWQIERARRPRPRTCGGVDPGRRGRATATRGDREARALFTVLVGRRVCREVDHRLYTVTGSSERSSCPEKTGLVRYEPLEHGSNETPSEVLWESSAGLTLVCDWNLTGQSSRFEFFVHPPKSGHQIHRISGYIPRNDGFLQFRTQLHLFLCVPHESQSSEGVNTHGSLGPEEAKKVKDFI